MSYGLSKRGALFVMAAVALLFAFPGLRHARGLEQADGFPVSRFTMFAHKRGDVQKIVYLRGIDRDGERRNIRVGDAWPGGMNAGWRRLNRLSVAKQETRDATCESVLERLSKRKRTRKVRQLEIVDARYSVTEYFREHVSKPRRERVVARCSRDAEDAGHRDAH